MTLISVILPFRDAAATINRAVDSILAQSFKDFELILINDGSTDESGEIINQYRDDRIKRIDLAPSGIVTALNEGIFASQGNIIARMDADDYSHPERFIKQLKFLENNPEIEVVSCKVDYKGNLNENYGFFHFVEWTNQLITPDEIFNNRFVESPLSHPTVMFKKRLIKKFGPYEDGNFPEDYEMWLRFMANGIKIAKVDEVLLDWHDSQNRLSRRHTKYSAEAFYEIKTKYFAEWFLSYFKNQPPILIWGVGKSVFQKSSWLEKFGLEVSGYIDVIEKDNYWINEKPVFHHSDLPDNVFILSYVSDRKGRINIYNFLKKNNYREGYDFYMMA